MNIYYSNPNCSKCRLGIELLKKTNLKYQVKEYLKEALTEEELIQLFSKLNLTPGQVVRKNEEIYKELNLENKQMNLKEWIQVIIKNPQLLERPILVTENNAIIGRPPEKLLEILNDYNG